MIDRYVIGRFTSELRTMQRAGVYRMELPDGADRCCRRDDRSLRPSAYR